MAKVKLLMIPILFVVLSGCSSSPQSKADLVMETFPGCEIVYQKNASLSVKEDMVIIIHESKLKIVFLGTTANPSAYIVGTVVVHGIEIKVKNNKELIRDLNQVLEKYGE